MAEYCSATDVSNRVTEAGYEHVADDDEDGAVGTGELAASVTPAIRWAGGIIDSYIQRRVSLASARASGNTWLCDRAIDLAAYRFVTTGGREGVESFTADRDETLELLKRVRDDGDGIPGLTVSEANHVDQPTGPYEIQSEWTT